MIEEMTIMIKKLTKKKGKKKKAKYNNKLNKFSGLDSLQQRIYIFTNLSLTLFVFLFI